MSDENPLSEKAGRWNDRPNAATPVIDPGLAPLGSDEEAGGARRTGGAGDAPRMPDKTTPEAGGIGVRLTPKVWYALAVAAAVVVIVVALSSFA
jgi:hypothetical protein